MRAHEADMMLTQDLGSAGRLPGAATAHAVAIHAEVWWLSTLFNLDASLHACTQSRQVMLTEDLGAPADDSLELRRPVLSPSTLGRAVLGTAGGIGCTHSTRSRRASRRRIDVYAKACSDTFSMAGSTKGALLPCMSAAASLLCTALFCMHAAKLHLPPRPVIMVCVAVEMASRAQSLPPSPAAVAPPASGLHGPGTRDLGPDQAVPSQHAPPHAARNRCRESLEQRRAEILLGAEWQGWTSPILTD